MSSKKELKYSSFDIVFYFLAIDLYCTEFNQENEFKNMLSSLYRKYFINSGLITSWPEAPTLDEVERYRGLTLKSEDMIEESFFRMPTTLTPLSLGIAPIFNRSVNYSKKKDDFSVSSSSFDSFKNMYIYHSIIFLLKDDFLIETTLRDKSKETNFRNIDQPFIKPAKKVIDEIPIEELELNPTTNEDPDNINKSNLKNVEEETVEINESLPL